jgi:hypothetical protein
MDTLTCLFDKALVKLLQELPFGLSRPDRARLVQDFTQGRAHLVFQFVLKLEAMREPPRLLFAAAHYDAAKSREAIRVCLQSASGHAKIRQLQADGMHAEAELFLGGSDLDTLPSLNEFVSSFLFGFAVERLVEGDHAAIHRAYGRARYHTEVFGNLMWCTTASFGP